MQQILQQFQTTRNQSKELCKPLRTEDYAPQSTDFASPPKWHLAHTSWFFEEMILKKYSKNYQVFDDAYSFLFNSYYNSIGERIERKNRGLITRPSIETIYEYRAFVDDKMIELLKLNPSKDIEELTILGINHEQQHQELLITDLKHTFSYNPIYPKFTETNYISSKNKSKGWLEIAEGIYNIGHEGDDFCFDNELGKHRVFLEPYKISIALVTNAEFIAFINDKGYEQAKYWLDDAWHWINQNQLKSPMYWKLIDGVWHQYTLSGLQPVNPDAILTHVSYYEASAFAFWSDSRLPTEFEWEVASKQLEWGTVWEWTNSAYLPYPNFKIANGAVGEYNGKFMINLMVLRGASSATAQNHSRQTYRNFFSPNTQWQFSGIRLAK
ncbi:ergothioneine biosynthesis protein EgtB [Bizionia arctica]|uniref:Ergothioneine biosynthesis protein EgtB n=1 Tax=Bizionia arctica TaxID=1495645 RepID=A0A917GQL5_9FLAO|nr:ergothioneine biosynthesis protein EgtB [Bizionia arctica]GGG54485.1 ergothioneine biosynthesis protein EgtB [Bizionia arctica]